MSSSLERRNYSFGDSSLELYIYVDENQNPWFKAKEVAVFLGYADADLNVRPENILSWSKLAIPSLRCEIETTAHWHPNTARHETFPRLGDVRGATVCSKDWETWCEISWNYCNDAEEGWAGRWSSKNERLHVTEEGRTIGRRTKGNAGNHYK